MADKLAHDSSRDAPSTPLQNPQGPGEGGPAGAAADLLAVRLKPLREQIDRLDEQILDLISRRASVAQHVGEIKKETGAPVYRPEREAEVLRRIAERNDAQGGPLPSQAVTTIYREIMSACRALERILVVAYLGPEGSYSELALIRQFGRSVEAQACGSFDEVFRQVETGAADFGIVAVENSTEGPVSRTLDLMLESPLKIRGEVAIRIEHQLLTKTGTMDGVVRIYAHQQALAQCLYWLNRHHPSIPREAVSSNSEAARLAALDPASAAIAGELAAQRYGLMAVATHIQDETHNTTRFAVIAREDTPGLGHKAAKGSGSDHTSLVLSVPNRPGAVHALLEPLTRHGVSMTRFESRPARNKEASGVWSYYFYIDVEGHQSDAHIAAALAELKELASFFKVLGSYPVAG